MGVYYLHIGNKENEIFNIFINANKKKPCDFEGKPFHYKLSEEQIILLTTIILITRDRRFIK